MLLFQNHFKTNYANKKLANMDENSLSQIDKKILPNSTTLANSINSLTNRIETYVKFKKELFIGLPMSLKHHLLL